MLSFSVVFQELMQSSPCVLSKWKSKYICQLLFGSGVLVSLSLSGPQLEKVVIDRSLVGKLISDTISDGNYTRVQINCPY